MVCQEDLVVISSYCLLRCFECHCNIQDFELSSPHVLVTVIYAPAAYHGRLEIINAGCHRSFYGLAPTDYTRVFIATQASYELPVGFSYNQ